MKLLELKKKFRFKNKDIFHVVAQILNIKHHYIRYLESAVVNSTVPLSRPGNYFLNFKIIFLLEEIVIKRTDPRCKDGNARFTTVPLKPLLDQYSEGYCRFSRVKSV